MNLNNYFVCPVCGATELSLLSARPFMSDVRLDTIKCEKCSVEWNLYSKVTEAQIDITYMPTVNNDAQQSPETTEEK